MSDAPAPLDGPDLAQGIPESEVHEGTLLLGHAHGEPVLLTRLDGKLCAVGATCPHHGGPLSEGLIVDGTIRCPWHHAAFDLTTGRAVRPPALTALPCWRVEVREELAVVTGRREPVREAPRRSRAWRPRPTVPPPESVVVVGGGAAGLAAVATLRDEGYGGPIALISAERHRPLDRTNLSKDLLAGTAGEDWLPLKPERWYAEQEVRLFTNRRVRAIEPRDRRVVLEGGSRLHYGALLLATGAQPVRLDLGAAARVLYLRTLDDCRAIIREAERSRSAIVIGASFIGLEVAAALRTRGLEVTVVAPESQPLERVLGTALGTYIREVHESHGVRFRLRSRVRAADEHGVILEDGARLPGDLVVAGVGVRPDIELAREAGLETTVGVLVDQRLETSAPGIHAAGDVALWPDSHTGRFIHVEHWVVAQRQGQTAARNILGGSERFDATPFFWSAHYDTVVSYVGHVTRPDHVTVDGNPRSRDCTVRYFEGSRLVAVATIGRDRESLSVEAELDRSRHRSPEFAA